MDTSNRHVSGPGNENVADATRFQQRSMPANVYCYCSRYTRTWSESPWQGGSDRDLVTFNNLSQVSYARHRHKNQGRGFGETFYVFMYKIEFTRKDKA